MNQEQRNDVRNVTLQLNSALTGLDFSATFGVVFTRRLATRIQEVMSLSYPNALRIACKVRVEAQLLIESDDDRDAVYELVEPYVHSIISIADELCDSDDMVLDVMEMIASHTYVDFG